MDGCDAAVHRLPERPRRRARLLLDNGAEVDRTTEDGGRRCRCRLPRPATSTRRGCCWTKARRSIGRGRTAATPLHVACANGGHVDAARLLLENGADGAQRKAIATRCIRLACERRTSTRRGTAARDSPRSPASARRKGAVHRLEGATEDGVGQRRGGRQGASMAPADSKDARGPSCGCLNGVSVRARNVLDKGAEVTGPGGGRRRVCRLPEGRDVARCG